MPFSHRQDLVFQAEELRLLKTIFEEAAAALTAEGVSFDREDLADAIIYVSREFSLSPEQIRETALRTFRKG